MGNIYLQGKHIFCLLLWPMKYNLACYIELLDHHKISILLMHGCNFHTVKPSPIVHPLVHILDDKSVIYMLIIHMSKSGFHGILNGKEGFINFTIPDTLTILKIASHIATKYER